MIQADRLAAVRRSLRRAIPVNGILGLAVLTVAYRGGLPGLGLAWFAASLSVNVARYTLCRMPVLPVDANEPGSVAWHLMMHRFAAFSSGIVWALVAILSSGFTTPDSIFYLTVLCGITAGAVTHGASYSPVPTFFITPPLLVMIGCLLWQGDFNSVLLGSTVTIYLIALLLSARESDLAFRDFSRLTHEAREMAQSLEIANASSDATAREMLHRATHDALTGLLNRSGILRSLEVALQAGNRPLCLMLLDLDDFKAVNDIFGHATGDRVLQKVARRLNEATPSGTSIARLGGDEFALLLELDDDRPEPVERLASRILATISAPFETFESSPVSGSVGICIAAEGSVGELLARADAALYAAKSAGKNSHSVFDGALQERIELERDLERDLGDALDRQAVEVWFQPIYHRSGRLDTLEALLRWTHPVHGPINPELIVRTAGRVGQAENLFRRVVDDALSMLLQLDRVGADTVRVAVNLSPREAAKIPADEILLGRCALRGVAPDRIEVEITEETALDLNVIRSRLMPLSKAGVRIVIDDFGEGYSSLQSIRYVRVSRLKIDRSFAADLGKGESVVRLLRALVGLGHALDMEVVAEGVESAEAARTLADIGCDYLQGYYLSRPMTAGAIMKLPFDTGPGFRSDTA